MRWVGGDGVSGCAGGLLDGDAAAPLSSAACRGGSVIDRPGVDFARVRRRRDRSAPAVGFDDAITCCWRRGNRRGRQRTRTRYGAAIAIFYRAQVLLWGGRAGRRGGRGSGAPNGRGDRIVGVRSGNGRGGVGVAAAGLRRGVVTERGQSRPAYRGVHGSGCRSFDRHLYGRRASGDRHTA